MGRRGSVVACGPYKREIAGSSPGWADFMLRLCASIGKALLLTHALSRPESKWVPGRTMEACVFE